MRYPLRLILAALVVPSLLRAQQADSAAAPAVRGLATVGSALEEQLRDAQLRGDAPAAGFLVRSPSSLTPHRPGAGVALILPQADFAWNSRIPTSANDGAMWAGRGASAVVMAGAELRAGAVRLVVAPELVWAENRAFDELLPRQWTAEQRADFLPPWQTAQHSADIPYRFGDGGWAKLRPGQSSLTVRAGGLAAGAATENQWWGPGVRNAVVMTDNAPGIPHLFARTARPLRTRLGSIDARWMVGTLAGSGYADSTAGAGRRSLNTAALVFHPGAAPNLAVGVARAVYAREAGFAGALGHSADVLTRWGGAGDTLRSEPFEQITSLMARWVFPRDGAEVYAEWARHRLPGSLGDLLEAPEHTQGYILGAQWLRPVRAGEIRLQAEAAGLEKSATFASRPIGSYYASAAVPQGYTHEGQVIGAGIGPGASSQWLAADWLHRGGRVGAFVGRVRNANDAYYDNPATARIRNRGKLIPQSTVHGHDVTVLGGLRGRLPLRALHVEAEWTAGKRYNYMFQSYAVDWNNREDAVDVLNHTLRLGISARR